jgi:hypothetical protein
MALCLMALCLMALCLMALCLAASARGTQDPLPVERDMQPPKDSTSALRVFSLSLRKWYLLSDFLLKRITFCPAS